MITLLTIDEGFISSMIEYVGIVFDDLKLLIFLLLGLTIGFFIIERIIETLLSVKKE